MSDPALGLLDLRVVRGEADRVAREALGLLDLVCVRGRRIGASEAEHQLAISDWPDAGRSHQPQAVGEVFDPMRGSVPFLRRRIFSRCFHRTSSAKPSSGRT